MIKTSFTKYGSTAPTQGGGNSASQDPNNNMQSSAPVQETQQGNNNTANPVELMGQVLQNVVKSVNQMIDIYSQMTGGASLPGQSDNTLSQGQQTQQNPQQQGAPAQTSASGPAAQTNNNGKTASYPTWGDVLGNG